MKEALRFIFYILYIIPNEYSWGAGSRRAWRMGCFIARLCVCVCVCSFAGVTRLNFSSGICQGVPARLDGQGLDSESQLGRSSHDVLTGSVYHLSDWALRSHTSLVWCVMKALLLSSLLLYQSVHDGRTRSSYGLFFFFFLGGCGMKKNCNLAIRCHPEVVVIFFYYFFFKIHGFLPHVISGRSSSLLNLYPEVRKADLW